MEEIQIFTHQGQPYHDRDKLEDIDDLEIGVRLGPWSLPISRWKDKEEATRPDDPN